MYRTAKVLGALLAAALLAAPAPAAAQPAPEPVTFGIRPATEKAPDPTRSQFGYGVTPGAVVRDHVAVSNISTSPLKLRVYASDAFNTTEGGFDLLAGNREPVEVGKWAALAEREVTVAGRSTVIVPFTLTIPANASPGDHAGGVVASLTTERTNAQGDKVAVDQRVGTRIYLRVAGDLKPSLAVEGFSGTYHDSLNPVGRGKATVTYTVRNTGNVRLSSKQGLKVSTPWGSTVDAPVVAELPELLPGNAITITSRVPDLWPAGWLTAQVRIEPVSAPGDQNPPLSIVNQSTSFMAVPWGPLLILLLFGALLFFVLRRRNRPRGSAASPSVQKSAEADLEVAQHASS